MLTSDLEKALSKTICRNCSEPAPNCRIHFHVPRRSILPGLSTFWCHVCSSSIELSFCFVSISSDKWGKKGDEENRVGSSAPFHLTHVKNYTRGTTRRLTVMRTGEEN